MPNIFDYARDGQLENLKNLIENEKDTYRAQSNGATPLIVAAEKGRVEIVRYLLSRENPRQKEVLTLINNRWDETGATAVYQAAQDGNLECLKLLLAAGANPNVCGKENISLLERTLSNRLFEMAAYLLIYGAAVNADMQKLIFQYRTEVTTAIDQIGRSVSMNDQSLRERCMQLLKRIGIVEDEKIHSEPALHAAFFAKRGLFSPKINDGKSCVSKLVNLSHYLQNCVVNEEKVTPPPSASKADQEEAELGWVRVQVSETVENVTITPHNLYPLLEPRKTTPVQDTRITKRGIFYFDMSEDEKEFLARQEEKKKQKEADPLQEEAEEGAAVNSLSTAIVPANSNEVLSQPTHASPVPVATNPVQPEEIKSDAVNSTAVIRKKLAEICVEIPVEDSRERRYEPDAAHYGAFHSTTMSTVLPSVPQHIPVLAEDTEKNDNSDNTRIILRN